MADSKKYNGSTWQHSLRKLTTATAETAAANEPLMKIGDYADTLSNAASIPTTEGANSITVDTTVQPSEFTATWTGWHDASVKEKSENLYNSAETDWEIGILDDNGNPTSSTTSHYTKNFTAVEPETAYYLSGTIYVGQSGHRVYYYDANKNWISRSVLIEYNNGNFATPANCAYVRVQVAVDLSSTSDWMLNTGSTALPYEPYWK